MQRPNNTYTHSGLYYRRGISELRALKSFIIVCIFALCLRGKHYFHLPKLLNVSEGRHCLYIHKPVCDTSFLVKIVWNKGQSMLLFQDVQKYNRPIENCFPTHRRKGK